MKQRTLHLMGGTGVLLGLLLGYTQVAPNSQLASALLGTSQQLEACLSDIATQYELEHTDTFTMTRMNLNEDSIVDFLVRLNDPSLCGSSGCVHEVCMSDTQSSGEYIHAPLGLSANSVAVGNGNNDGHRDLTLTSNQTDTTIEWAGDRYRISY